MKHLTIFEARDVMSRYPLLRLHMIPAQGLYLKLENIWIVANFEGEVTLVRAD